jgi:RsmE family RNA methyltransferase
VNLLLFSAEEAKDPLPRSDPRAGHLLDVLRRQPGDTFDAGLVNGPRGRGTLVAIGAANLELAFAWGEPPAPADPIIMVVGLPRPQTARDILRDVTTLGISELHFVACEKSEASYARSALWTDGEWRRQVLAGAAQAFDTRVPEVRHGATLEETLALLPPAAARLALDNYEATTLLSDCPLSREAVVVLALGPERGWSAMERDLLRASGFTLAGLGPRVLRTETAAIAALTLVKATRGLL